MNKKSYILSLLFLVTLSSLTCQNKDKGPKTGAERTDLYFNLLKGRRIAVVANQTSVIGETHLVDSLVAAGFDVVKVFGPEHGFRGDASAGELILDNTDPITGIPVISLYGSHKKPTAEDLADLDLVVFDIQDVGARFYTYISTMTYVMEACAENNTQFLVLDRPNPHGDYVDGPVLKDGFESFVGLHHIPVVHGMTVGEYARMVNGEGWLEKEISANLKVIPVDNYNHTTQYALPVGPSPNLPNDDAICLYPSICFFEGTVVSVGRGTNLPFQVLGHPDLNTGSITFTPESRPEAKYPKLEGIRCFGQNLHSFAETTCINDRRIHLSWLINYYEQLKDNTEFFNDYFDTLAGDSTLRNQIVTGQSEEEIRQSWQADLDNFKSIRKKYLLYPDFE